MTTATAPRESETSAAPASGSSVLIHDVSWDEYESLLDWVGDRRIRLNYDRGSLEIMSPSPEHEWGKSVIGGLVRQLALELGLAFKSGGSTTFRRRLKERGLEPDECFWLRSEAAVRGKKIWRAEVDPPPDLVVEVEVTHSILDRLSILAGLGVPEVWRYDSRIRIFLLQPDESYAESETSLTLPGVPVGRLADFVKKAEGEGELDAMRALVAWIRAGFPAP
jgi:Uma2 family endonuclease